MIPPKAFVEKFADVVAYPVKRYSATSVYLFREFKDKRITLSICFALNAVDSITTQFIVKEHGVSVEMNPWVRNFMESYGSIGGDLIYTTIAVLMLYGVSKLSRFIWNGFYSETTKRFVERLPFYIVSLGNFCAALINLNVLRGG